MMVPLCYLTLRFQDPGAGAAGVLRIRWTAFTLVQLPGALARAVTYATIGFAAWQAALAAGAGSPWAFTALVVGVGALLVALAAHRQLAGGRLGASWASQCRRGHRALRLLRDQCSRPEM